LTKARQGAEVKLIETMEADPTYLATWNATRVASAAKGVNASYRRVRADPAKHAAYNERQRQRYYRVNAKPVPEVTESTLEAQLLRIYEKARREAEKKNRKGM
jgi:hypothetical protein